VLSLRQAGRRRQQGRPGLLPPERVTTNHTSIPAATVACLSSGLALGLVWCLLVPVRVSALRICLLHGRLVNS
jgi:hypothetical protein